MPIYGKKLPSFSICSLQFTFPPNAGDYLNRDPAQVLTPRTKFPPFSFDLKIFLNLLIYSFETFNFIFSSRIPKYLQLSPSCNDLITLPFGNSIPTDFTIFPFSAHFL